MLAASSVCYIPARPLVRFSARNSQAMSSTSSDLTPCRLPSVPPARVSHPLSSCQRLKRPSNQGDATSLSPRSNHVVAAVHVPGGADIVRARVRGEQDDGRGDFFDVAEPHDRQLGQLGVPPILRDGEIWQAFAVLLPARTVG